MRRSHWAVAAFVPVFARPALAQVSYPNCSAASLEWSYNSLGQNPCYVAAYLESSCNGGQFQIPPLTPGVLYGGPFAGGSTLCQCNTVVYSLVSACGACQGGSWVQWSQWSFNCSSVSEDGTYPTALPRLTRVPRWAYLSVVKANTWNITLAQIAGDSPEGTPTTVATVQASSTASAVSQNPTSNSHAGRIAGGVVGGVVAAALLIGLIFWYIRRRRRRAEPLPSPFVGNAAHVAEAFGQPGHGVSTPIGKYYDPSDPSTFPTPFASVSMTAIQTTEDSLKSHSPESTSTKNRTQYQGLPIV
ncbi:hypothetical protein F5148DRAFT_1218816 [Russula earlei]|uniref:Uncharacterized protein n=1 Tax=Russula earlei TaxID=71964 RepID=A0ACC0U4U4_9AGAM|nr:hypothetical protein F5148DRAFT_1218816 [Russula earlei]